MRRPATAGLTLQHRVQLRRRAEIVDACRQLARDVRTGGSRPEEIDEVRIGRALYTDGVPDPDLLIRTSGEMRLSQLPALAGRLRRALGHVQRWPDFGRATSTCAVADFQRRDRRCGRRVMLEARVHAPQAPVDAPTPSRMTELGKRVLQHHRSRPDLRLDRLIGGLPGSSHADDRRRRHARELGVYTHVPAARVRRSSAKAGLLWGGLVTLAFVRPRPRWRGLRVIGLGTPGRQPRQGRRRPRPLAARGGHAPRRLLRQLAASATRSRLALPDGVHWVLLLVWVTRPWETAPPIRRWARSLGATSSAPGIGPGKTVEGATAQLAASLLAALTAGGWLFPGLLLRDALAVDSVGCLGQVGDLVESALKRSCGHQNTGHVIPGHGGILDRIDGFLFNAPVLFYYVTYGRAWSA